MNTSQPQHHIACAAGDVAPSVLLPGSLERVQEIAGLFDEQHHIATHREFITYTGQVDGVPISVTSTGIGCPSASIAVEELVNIGAKLLIRVGTCGALQPSISPGDVIIVTGAVRGEGTSREYVPIEYPALADYRVVAALVEACRQMGIEPHVGVIRSHDAFYMESPLARGRWRERIQPWVEANVLALENESSAVFVVSSLRQVMAGAILVAAGSLVRDGAAGQIPSSPDRVELASRAAILAARNLSLEHPDLQGPS